MLFDLTVLHYVDSACRFNSASLGSHPAEFKKRRAIAYTATAPTQHGYAIARFGINGTVH